MAGRLRYLLRQADGATLETNSYRDCMRIKYPLSASTNEAPHTCVCCELLLSQVRPILDCNLPLGVSPTVKSWLISASHLGDIPCKYLLT